MPAPSPALTARRRRIALLRRRVAATLAATFALAFGVVAFDGSTGATADSASTGVVATQTDSITTADSSASVSTDEPLTTSQS